MFRLPAPALVLLTVCWIAGCGGGNTAKPPALGKVNGTVKLDGSPMAGGEIRFTVTGQPPKTMEIKNGSFAGEAHVGKNQVDVLWEKEGPPHPMDPAIRLKVNTISDKYSGPKSILNAEVSAAGPNDFKFDVSKK